MSRDVQRSGTTVYVLNCDGVNRWSVQVQPGWDDLNARLEKAECERIAERIRSALAAPGGIAAMSSAAQPAALETDAALLRAALAALVPVVESISGDLSPAAWHALEDARQALAQTGPRVRPAGEAVAWLHLYRRDPSGGSYELADLSESAPPPDDGYKWVRSTPLFR